MIADVFNEYSWDGWRSVNGIFCAINSNGGLGDVN